jgi:predicted dehydrogenase
MRLAIIGCGFVADFYIQTIANHPRLEVSGVYDCNADRLSRFSTFYKLHQYSCMEEVLSDSSVQLIVNLTNPASHYAVSKVSLEAGKHVYSEKPLAMTFNEAEDLVSLAERNNLLLASAPCNLLSETAQTFWKALRDGRIGIPRLAYAELDEGQLFMNYKDWVSKSGTPWPFKDEFEVGSTLEHAGYYLGWLTAFFGPAKQMVSWRGVYADSSGPVKEHYAPAFAIACIDFACGLVARITCSTYTSGDHSFRVFGDDGTLSTVDSWDYASPVHIQYRVPRSWQDKHPRRAEFLLMRPRIPLVRRSAFAYDDCRQLRMDFGRGIAEVADALSEGREPRLSARWSLHVTELALAMNAGEGIRREMRTTFAPIAPMPWAI